MHRIKALRILLRKMQHAGRDYFQAVIFKAGINPANYVFCHRIGFYDGQGSLDSHSLLQKETKN
jgi:hypothetical protein